MPFEINSVNPKAMSCIQVTLSRVRELMAAAAVIVSDRAVILCQCQVWEALVTQCH